MEKSGYESVRRYTKKVNIFKKDLILIPIHLPRHWCLAIIDNQNKEIRYYDSLGKPNDKCLNALVKYLADESMDKKNQPLTTHYELITETDIPKQDNQWDCGIFACKYAEYTSRWAIMNFTQNDMPRFRQEIKHAILQNKIQAS